jgi:hypothetical protein
VKEAFADALSIAVMSFLDDLFADQLLTDE